MDSSLFKSKFLDAFEELKSRVEMNMYGHSHWAALELIKVCKRIISDSEKQSLSDLRDFTDFKKFFKALEKFEYALRIELQCPQMNETWVQQDGSQKNCRENYPFGFRGYGDPMPNADPRWSS